MNKNTCYILGTVFIINSGLIYTLERAISIFLWNGEVIARVNGASPSYHPGTLEPFMNFFVPIFLVAGIILFIYGTKLKA